MFTLAAESCDCKGRSSRNRKARPPKVKDCATKIRPRRMSDKKPKISRSRDKAVGYRTVKGISQRVMCPSTLKTCQRRGQAPEGRALASAFRPAAGDSSPEV